MYAECGSWIKVFKDGTKEQGSDFDIQENKASWTHGRQEGITEVLLSDSLRLVSLSVFDTDWYQFDRYVATIQQGKQTPLRSHRIIQAEIKEHHVGHRVIGTLENKFFTWALVSEKEKVDEEHDYDRPIERDDIGRWISVVLYSNGPVLVSFSAKGKTHG